MEAKTGAQSPQNTPAHFIFCGFRVIHARPRMIAFQASQRLYHKVHRSCRSAAYTCYHTIPQVLYARVPNVFITHIKYKLGQPMCC